MRAEINPKRCLIGKLNQAIKKIFPALQEKTATPTEQQQEITADTGVYGLSKVTINRIPQEYIVPSGSIEITENGTYDVTNKASASVNVSGSEYNVKMDIEMTSSMTEVRNYITKLPNINTSNMTSTANLFANMKSLKEIPNIDTSNSTNCSSMFEYCYTITTIPNIDISKSTACGRMFGSCTNLVSIPNINTSSCKNFSGMFGSCTNLVSIPNIDTSKNEGDMTQVFHDCKAITSIPNIDTSKARGFYGFCSGCSSLVNVPVLDTSAAINMGDMFLKCSNLSNESLNNILQMCINATSMSSNKTLKRLGLSQAQATICQGLSNYQAFLDAGWSTGY